MAASSIIPGNGLARRINVFCLFAAIILVLVLPLRKEIWYDETVSMLCSKGLSHDAPASLGNAASVSSDALQELNTPANVFRATVNDNANSLLYNYGLHWFTAAFGNSPGNYMLFSKLCAIAALLAFYALCNLIFHRGIYTAVAIVLLATDFDFSGMSHEIRAYMMGILFVTLAALYLFRFAYRGRRQLHLFLAATCAAAAILSHFLCIYIVAVLVIALLVIVRGSLFTLRNIIAIAIPVVLLGACLYAMYSGLQIMGAQSRAIAGQNAASIYSLPVVLSRSMRFTAVNFKVLLPAISGSAVVIAASFFIVLAMYAAALRLSVNKLERAISHLLFALGMSATVFLLALSLRSHHYTSLYYRYYSFSIPFASLFMAWLLCLLFRQPRTWLRYTFTVAVLLSSCVLYALGIRGTQPQQSFNHVSVAAIIRQQGVTRIDVPEWRDALLIHTLLPKGYKIDYFRNPAAPRFVLYSASRTDTIPVISTGGER